jgi:ABC-type transport system involved in cytochrome c biogenesis ATPase subunit
MENFTKEQKRACHDIGHRARMSFLENAEYYTAEEKRDCYQAAEKVGERAESAALENLAGGQNDA